MKFLEGVGTGTRKITLVFAEIWIRIREIRVTRLAHKTVSIKSSAVTAIHTGDIICKLPEDHSKLYDSQSKRNYLMMTS